MILALGKKIISDEGTGKTPMREMHRYLENMAKFKKLTGDFVLTELKLGLQFANMGSMYMTEGNVVAVARNLGAAEKAYESILHFLPHAGLTKPQREQVERDLPHLRDSLAVLQARLKIDS